MAESFLSMFIIYDPPWKIVPYFLFRMWSVEAGWNPTAWMNMGLKHFKLNQGPPGFSHVFLGWLCVFLKSVLCYDLLHQRISTLGILDNFWSVIFHVVCQSIRTWTFSDKLFLSPVYLCFLEHNSNIPDCPVFTSQVGTLFYFFDEQAEWDAESDDLLNGSIVGNLSAAGQQLQHVPTVSTSTFNLSDGFHFIYNSACGFQWSDPRKSRQLVLQL